jgi:hypothetical protein
MLSDAVEANSAHEERSLDSLRGARFGMTSVHRGVDRVE